MGRWSVQPAIRPEALPMLKSVARIRGYGAAALLGALSALLPSLAGTAHVLEPFSASYAWIWHGATVAISTVKLERRDVDTWAYSSSSEPRGLGNLYPLRPNMQSVLRLTVQGVEPLSYHATDGSSANARGAQVRFDWDAARITGTYEGTDVDLPLKPGVQDDLSIQIALLVALRQGRPPGVLSLIDKNSIRDYTYSLEGEESIATKLGQIQTVIYASHHEGSPRVTRFWCAPSKGYVPVRIQQKRVDSVEWTMEIQSLQAPAN
jgi:hypothetical protein